MDTLDVSGLRLSIPLVRAKFVQYMGMTSNRGTFFRIHFRFSVFCVYALRQIFVSLVFRAINVYVFDCFQSFKERWPHILHLNCSQSALGEEIHTWRTNTKIKQLQWIWRFVLSGTRTAQHQSFRVFKTIITLRLVYLWYCMRQQNTSQYNAYCLHTKTYTERASARKREKYD